MKYLQPIPDIENTDNLIDELMVLKKLITYYQPNEEEDGFYEELDIRITMIESVLTTILSAINDGNTDTLLKLNHQN